MHEFDISQRRMLAVGRGKLVHPMPDRQPLIESAIPPDGHLKPKNAAWKLSGTATSVSVLESFMRKHVPAAPR
jgi:hypothetical protein